MDALNSRTPCCDASCKFPRYTAATTVVRRTCRKCGGRWQVIVRPVGVRNGRQYHVLDWTPLRPTVTAAEVAAMFPAYADNVAPLADIAAELNSRGVALEGSTDPEASWTEDDVAQCVEWADRD